ncbi:lactonase family protein, partial [Acinetobacter baumannii]
MEKETCVEIRDSKVNDTNIKYRGLIQKLTATLSLSFLSLGWGSTVNAAEQQIALVGTWTSIPDAPLVQKPEKASEGLYQL